MRIGMNRIGLLTVVTLLACSGSSARLASSGGGQIGAAGATAAAGAEGSGQVIGAGGAGGQTMAGGGSTTSPGQDAGAADIPIDGPSSTCEGTPSVTCASSGCESIAGCTATTPSCAGTAQACSAFGGKPEACAKQAGCSASAAAGTCFTVYPCSHYDVDRITCNQIPGCSYNQQYFGCSGTAASCEALTSKTSCLAQANCGWEAATSVPCTGTAKGCATLSGASCVAQAGCSQVAAVCTGSPTACRDLPVTACARQPGCNVSTPGGPDAGPLDGSSQDGAGGMDGSRASGGAATAGATGTGGSSGLTGGTVAAGGASGGTASSGGSSGGTLCAGTPVGLGMACACASDCPAEANCCDGSSQGCDVTKQPSDNAASPGQFVVSSDGLTVADTITGLVWQRDGNATKKGCSGGMNTSCTWPQAKAYCAGLTLGGLTGWRLPSRTELVGLVGYSGVGLYDDTAFPNTPSQKFWTSTPSAAASDSMWYVSFETGDSYAAKAAGSLYYVRCVR